MSADLPRIDLAHEPHFTLGRLEVRPTRLDMIADERRESLEPRVMQVLVALAREVGQVVSRDDLIRACWGGRVVGDDAINRCIGRLRALTRTYGSFEIETIPRVGYRLTECESAPASPRSPPSVLLAVLPFDDLSADGDLGYFSDGISEEILHTVARRTDLKVIGRASSFAFRGPAKAARNVSEALAATHVMDGSVRRSGDRVRITAELVECAGQTTMWSDHFDRDLRDVLRLQDEIAVAVASALKARLSGPAADEPISPDAYDLFLRARGVQLHVAVGLLERAITLAPRFTPAWAELAHLRAIANRGLSLDLSAPTVSRAAVITAADQALRLDPTCGLAHVALAQLLPWGDYSGREASLMKAFSIGSPVTETATEVAWFLATVGRCEEAVTYASQALALDPLHSGAANAYAQSLGFSGRYDEALHTFADARNRWPDRLAFLFAPLYLTATAGDWAEYDRLRRQAEALKDPGRHTAQALAAGAMLRDPTAARCERVLSILRDQLASTGTVQLSTLSLAHRMGPEDEAFRFAEQASFAHLQLEDGPSPAGQLSQGIIFNRSVPRPMMMDRRFVDLCGKLGLCRYWSTTGCWPDCASIVPYDFKAMALAWLDVGQPQAAGGG